MNRDDILTLFQIAAADRERGASQIEEDLIRGLLAVGDPGQPDWLRDGADMLVAGQPAMANLRGLAAVAADGDAELFRAWLEERSRTVARLPEMLAARAWPSIEGRREIVTISRSTAVAAVVEGAWDRGDGTWAEGVRRVYVGTNPCAIPSREKVMKCMDEIPLSQTTCDRTVNSD